MSCVFVDTGVRLISPLAAVTTSFGSKLLQKQLSLHMAGNKLYALAAVTQCTELQTAIIIMEKCIVQEAHGLYLLATHRAFPHINTMT